MYPMPPSGGGRGWCPTTCPPLAGNIDVVEVSEPQRHGRHVLRLRIHPDPHCESDGKEHFQ